MKRVCQAGQQKRRKRRKNGSRRWRKENKNNKRAIGVKKGVEKQLKIAVEDTLVGAERQTG